jgi:hypothetical protein
VVIPSNRANRQQLAGVVVAVGSICNAVACLEHSKKIALRYMAADASNI